MLANTDHSTACSKLHYLRGEGGWGTGDIIFAVSYILLTRCYALIINWLHAHRHYNLRDACECACAYACVCVGICVRVCACVCVCIDIF